MKRAPHNKVLRVAAASLAIPLALTGQPTLTGQLTLRGSAGHTENGSYFRALAGNTLTDHTAHLRLLLETPLGDNSVLDTHYDLGTIGGDTWAARSQVTPPAHPAGPSDDRRSVDLTRDLHRGSRSLAYHRLDRLAVHWTTDWGKVTAGRTAITWGNGLVFNVQDLFNPFDPHDIDRDYKTGDDLLLVETQTGGLAWQFLAIPRRDPADRDHSHQHSSLAAHVSFTHGDIEWTAFAGAHYDEFVTGLGRVATVGNTIWRSDILITRLAGGDVAFAALTNLDYSWVWAGLNCYGAIEAHYNSLGHSDPWIAQNDPNLATRMARGELFTLGRTYLAGTLQVEFHALLNVGLTSVIGLDGPSGLLQPHVKWDIRQDLQLTLGAQLSLGARGTEYGGIIDPATGLDFKSPQTAFLWLKAWF